MKLFFHLLKVFLLAAALRPFATSAADQLPTRSPFGITVAAVTGTGGAAILRVNFTVPAECVLYFDRLHFCTADGVEIQPSKMPEPVAETDRVTGKLRKVYLKDFSVELNPVVLPDQQLAVKFQGCTNAACFFPEQRRFAPKADGTFAEMAANTTPVDASAPAMDAPSSSAVDWAQELKDFTIKGQQTGYLKPSEFTAFLDQAAAGRGVLEDPLIQFKKTGLITTLLMIVLGGVFLNFTPCILPMIPINLAIIGAGAKAKSRAAGFKNGSIYGLGMALAYGTLGLVVVLTGSKFGTLNSSVWFNVGIALIFGVLALGMFDVLNIDLSRFSGGGPMGIANRGAWAQNAVVLSMGAMSALLAGACVAPVVISVVLLAANFYAKGAVAGLALPFLLGVGMAAPWPFAGAGLTFLPKPGKWMKYVKYVFGIMILGFAIYYSHLAWRAYQSGGGLKTVNPAGGPGSQPPTESEQALLAALHQSRDTGQPLFIDFHASWCKDCSAMDESVFNRAEVRQHLQKFIAVRYAAEQPGAAPAKTLLDHFNIIGLPTYLVLSSK
jgi:thioredoxin:protein disulfide reductase